MRLTSMDINNKEFRRSLRGYDPDEVDEFLDKIVEDYEEIFKENSALKEKVAVLNEKLEHYSKVEDTIQNTLLLAQNAAEQAKQSAKKEADLIMKNANDSAQRILDKANHDVVRINDDYETIKQEFVKFRAKFKNFMNTQVEMFNSLEADFEKNYNVGISLSERLKEKDIEPEIEEFKANEVKEENFSNDLNEIKSFFVKE
ncbi:MAG: DivIVA domain-containing protein [Bacillota bacterium]|nr:DivIVA domain-containing protein [Bacillota bacterium]